MKDMKNNDTFLQLLAIRRMTGTPAEWNTLKREQAKEIAGKIEKDKSTEFAKYVDDCFMSICDELHVFDMAHDWENKGDAEKLAVAGNIIRRFVARVKGDMQNGRAKKYNDRSVESVPEISVTRVDGGQMSVSNDGHVNVNPRFKYYNNLINFLMDLRHEAAHVVDIFFPSLSPLEPEIWAKAQMFYVNANDDFDLYSKNPLELNANMRRREFGELVRAKITEREIERVKKMFGNKMGGLVRGR